MYSNPPKFGCTIAKRVLANTEYFDMSGRIVKMRQNLVVLVIGPMLLNKLECLHILIPELSITKCTDDNKMDRS